MTAAETGGRGAGQRRWLWLLAAAAVLGAAAWQFGPWRARPVLVPVETMADAPTSLVLAANGRIAPRHGVNLRAAVAAKVISVEVEEGQKVEAGALLARLDPSLAQARLAQARAALEGQEVRQRQAEVTSDRATALGASSISRANVEDAALTLEAAKTEVARLRASLAEAERGLQDYQITAPIAGVVLARNLEPGQMVGLSDDLFLLADPADMVVKTDIDELYASRISVGQKAWLSPVGQAQALPGEVSFAAPRVNEATGARAIELRFEQPVDLPVGLTVNTNVVVQEIAAALTLPRSAILTADAGSAVLVIEDGRATRRAVQFQDWPAVRVVVTQGLAAGDQVILTPEATPEGRPVVAR